MHFNVETGWKSKTLGSLTSCSDLPLSLLFISFFFFSKSVAFANSNKGKPDPDYQSLSLSSYYERLEPDRLPPGGASAPPPADFNSNEVFAGITVRQLLFNSGQTYYSAKSARIGTQAKAGNYFHGKSGFL